MRILLTIPMLLCFVSCGGIYTSYDAIHEYHGKTVKFNTSMVYATNLNEIYSQDSEIKEYKRFLLQEAYFHKLSNECAICFKTKEKKFEKIKPGMGFVIIKSYRRVPWGIISANVSETRNFVLEDEDGILSIYPEYKMKEEYSK